MLKLFSSAWLTSNFSALNMVQYTLAQSPEIILTVSGKDSAKAREKAMDQLIELMDAGKLPTELEEGFGPQQLIEVKEASIEIASGEDHITQAVQILSNLATLKLKVQESRAEALEIRKAVDVLFCDQSVTEDEITQAVQILSNLASLKLKVQESRTEALEIRQAIDVLFSDKSVTEEEITHLKEGFKVLKNFAQANLRYQEARAKAEQARQVLDQALKSPEN